jgi:hypothetical protein
MRLLIIGQRSSYTVGRKKAGVVIAGSALHFGLIQILSSNVKKAQKSPNANSGSARQPCFAAG